jgi:DNA-binding response OmpR family regulator
MATTNESMPSGDTSTVLIVDDDLDMLKLCAVKLGAQGYTVLTAIGSVEAHRICTDYPKKIDLILLDVMLYPPSVQLDSSANVSPRMHGDKLWPMLRTKRPFSRLILMSASSPWKLGGRGMRALLCQYPFLQKPFTGDMLLEKVRSTLAQEPM